jgi:hypothetical protein
MAVIRFCRSIGHATTAPRNQAARTGHDLRAEGRWHHVVEFPTAAGDALAIPIPRTEAAIIRPLQERMPHGLIVPKALL